MSSLKAIPRNKLESMEQELHDALSEASAMVTAIRAEFEQKLLDPVKRQDKARSSLAEIKAELDNRRARDAMVPTVSDHAMLRYIERVHGIDVDHLRSHILNDRVVTALKNGAAQIKTEECTFVARDMTIVTVTTPKPEKTKQRKPTRAMREAMEDG